MTCKHEGDRITAMTRPTPLSGTWSDPALAHFADIKQCDICEDCGAWLSIGPANDTDAVKIEIRAALLAADVDAPTMSKAEYFGWCGSDLCGPGSEHERDWLAGWLGEAIWMHDAERP